jgi:hypothetical protein
MSEANKNEQMVLAYFVNEAAARLALESLKVWDKADESIKLGHMGILAKDADGKIKKHVERNTGKGALVGAGIGVLAAFLGPIGLVGGLLSGGLLGGAFGALSKKGLGLTPEDMQAVNKHLDSGQAALVVLLDDDEAAPTIAQLQTLGAVDVTGIDISLALLPEAEKVVNDAVGAAGAAAATVTAAASGVVSGAADATKSVAGAAEQAVGAAAEVTKDTTKKVTGAAEQVVGTAADATKTAASATKGAVDTVVDTTVDTAKGVASATKGAVDAAASAVDDAAKKV